MPQFVYNGLARFDDILASQVAQIRPRTKLPENASAKVRKKMEERQADEIERAAVQVRKELEDRDAGFELWGIVGHKDHPLALRFDKGVPVEVEEPPPASPKAKKTPEVNLRWAKLMALVESGTLQLVAADPGLSALNAPEAIALVGETSDVEKLSAWLDAETRKGVSAALKDRIAELQAAA